LSDARATPDAPVGLGGGLADELLASLPVEVDWDAQASRPRAGLLTYHFSTSYQVTMAGRAYGGHGKPAVGRSEGAPSADRATIPSDGIRKGKGLKGCNQHLSSRSGLSHRAYQSGRPIHRLEAGALLLP